MNGADHAGGERRDGAVAPGHRQRNREKRDHHAKADHRGDRRRVEQVVGRQRRDRLARGQSMPREKDLGGLARDHAERRDVADGVAGEEGAEGLAD